MVFATPLRELAKSFRAAQLPGSFLAVHLRRSDFLYSRGETVASIDAVVRQVRILNCLAFVTFLGWRSSDTI
jgi:hypothetical protein